MSERNSKAEVPNNAGGRPRDPLIEEAIIKSTRMLLATKGYSSMTIGDIVADAGVTRPTLYRRWSNKYDLVVEALQYGLQKQREAYPPLDLGGLSPREGLIEAVRRINPRFHNPRAMTLHGNFMAESEREPTLHAQIREQANKPRCDELAEVLVQLQRRGAIREDTDVDMIVSLAFGSYFADFNRYGRKVPSDFAERVVDSLWLMIADEPGPVDA